VKKGRMPKRVRERDQVYDGTNRVEKMSHGRPSEETKEEELGKIQTDEET
jgi:hypothetical protein